jgi:hypothetical protein
MDAFDAELTSALRDRVLVLEAELRERDRKIMLQGLMLDAYKAGVLPEPDRK